MRRRTLLTCLLATLTIAALAPPAGAAARACGSVAFTPQSDDGAFGIRAEGVRCRAARGVARASEPYGPSGEPGDVYRYRARRFRCVGRQRDTGLPSIRFRCRRGDAVVTFSRS